MTLLSDIQPYFNTDIDLDWSNRNGELDDVEAFDLVTDGGDEDVIAELFQWDPESGGTNAVLEHAQGLPPNMPIETRLGILRQAANHFASLCEEQDSQRGE